MIICTAIWLIVIPIIVIWPIIIVMGIRFSSTIRFIPLGATLSIDPLPACTFHERARLGDEAFRQLLIHQRQVLMRDRQQVDVVFPVVGKLCVFVNAFGNEC